MGNNLDLDHKKQSDDTDQNLHCLLGPLAGYQCLKCFKQLSLK